MQVCTAVPTDGAFPGCWSLSLWWRKALTAGPYTAKNHHVAVGGAARVKRELRRIHALGSGTSVLYNRMVYTAIYTCDREACSVCMQRAAFKCSQTLREAQFPPCSGSNVLLCHTSSKISPQASSVLLADMLRAEPRPHPLHTPLCGGGNGGAQSQVCCLHPHYK